VATSDEEQAVSTVRLGPSRPSIKDTRLASICGPSGMAMTLDADFMVIQS